MLYSLKRFLFEWLAVVLALLLFVVLAGSSQVVALSNNRVYDYLISSQSRAPDARIVVVGIDDASLSDLGRWPWSRKIHADLLNRLSTYAPRGVLFDVVMTEPSADDVLLKAAMHDLSQVAPVAVPMLLSSYAGEPATATLPIAAVSDSARLGQIVNLSDSDGVVRQAGLSLLDKNGKAWPTLSAQLLDDAARKNALAQYGTSFRVPFNTKAAYATVPYASVLRGEVPLDVLRDKYVLIGATAVGLGDQITTPSSSELGTFSGVEFHANTLDALLNGTGISAVTNPWALWINLLFAPLLLMLVFLRLSERYYAAAFVAFLLVYLALVVYLLWVQRLWLPPVLTMLALLLAYLLWSWRRAAVVLRYVHQELASAQASTGLLPQFLLRRERSARFFRHSLESKMQKIHQLYQFTGNGLARLPTALLVVGADGEILFVNQDAQTNLNVTERFLSELLQRFGQNIATDEEGAWLNRLQNIELNSALGAVYRLHVTVVALGDMSGSVWLVNFLDLSSERLAEQQRGELVRFLSHDLRTPQVSILALLALQKNPATHLPEPEFHAKITEKVQSTLDWAQDLVELSQAKSEVYATDEINLAHVLDESYSHVLDVAAAKHIQLQFLDAHRETAEQIWLLADGALLVRALVNVLSNALRYSPVSSVVKIEIERARSSVACRIIDAGQGMSAAQVARLNSGQSPIGRQDLTDAAGSLGVGFLMARTVVLRHGGRIEVSSELGRGTMVVIELPIT